MRAAQENHDRSRTNPHRYSRELNITPQLRQKSNEFQDGELRTKKTSIRQRLNPVQFRQVLNLSNKRVELEQRSPMHIH